MRLNITPKHPGLIIAASLLCLTACGGADKTDTPAETPAASTQTTAPVTTPAASAPAATPVTKAQDKSATVDAHVHGEAELSITRSGDDYTVELFSPVDNFGADESETNAEALSAAISDSLGGTYAEDVLDAFSEHFIWPVAADCSFANGSEIYGYNGDGTHANATLIATFNCEDADAVDQVQVDLLNLSGIEKIHAVALIGDAQFTGELTSTERKLELK